MFKYKIKSTIQTNQSDQQNQSDTHISTNQYLIQNIILNKKIDLNNYSIYDIPSYDTIYNMLIESDLKKKKGLGCFMGMVVGDALGAPLEFMPINYHPKYLVKHMTSSVKFGINAGQWTDDASMGLCIADSLLMKKRFDPADQKLRYLAWWYCGYNNAFRYDTTNLNKKSIGLGGNISKSFDKFIKTGEIYSSYGDTNINGNGSIMRNAPIPVAYHRNMSKAIKYAKLQSQTTHQGIEAAECCALLTYLCVSFINTNSIITRPDIALEYLIKQFTSNNININKLLNSQDPWNWKADKFFYDEYRSNSQPDYVGSYSTDCLAMALYCVRSTKNLSDAIVKAVNYGGDADSVGSVTGQLAGAIYGYDQIPLDWIQSINYWSQGSIIYRTHMLYELFAE